MDGVIVDSEYTFFESKAEILTEAGRPRPLDYHYQFMGTSHKFMWSKMKAELELPKPIDYYISEMNHKRELIIEKDGVKAIKGVVSFIKQLKDKEIKLAVASSSPRNQILKNLRELKLLDYFQVIVSGEEVKHSKPAPDIFLKAAVLLNETPSNCIVYEDTKNGSLAAKTAGMYVIGFANPDYPAQDLSACDEIITEFE